MKSNSRRGINVLINGLNFSVPGLLMKTQRPKNHGFPTFLLLYISTFAYIRAINNKEIYKIEY